MAGGGGGPQGKRLRLQADKDKEDAARALEAKKRRLEKERELASEEAKMIAAKKKLEFEKDKAAAEYYEASGANDRGSGRPRSKGAPPAPGSVSHGSSGRASAVAPKSRASAAQAEEENIPPAENEERYPGWDRGDDHVGQDLDERSLPFVRRTEDDEDRGSGSESDKSGHGSSEEEAEEERFRTGMGRRGPRHEPAQPLALARGGRCLSRMISI